MRKAANIRLYSFTGMLAVAIALVAAPCGAYVLNSDNYYLLATGAGNSKENDNPVSAQATFIITSANTLKIVLKNTTAGGTIAQGDALTGVVFTVGLPNPEVSLNSISLPSGSNIYIDEDTVHNTVPLVNSWWGTEMGTGFDAGVGTTGVGVFKKPSVDQITGNASPDYAVVSAGTFPKPPYDGIDGSKFPFVQDTLTFILNLHPPLLEPPPYELEILKVWFLFGTEDGGFIEATNLHIIPEPSSVIVWGVICGLGVAVGWRRRRRKPA